MLLRRRNLIGTCALLLMSCIAYDQDIGVFSQDYNPSPVRIVEAAHISAEANAACKDASQRKLDACPVLQTPIEQVPHLLNPDLGETYKFCACRDEQRHDLNGLRPFSIRVEDQDEEDEVFAALILDYDTSNSKNIVPNWKFYAEYLDPDNPLQEDKNSFYGRDVLNRPPPNVRYFELGRTAILLDLCNGAIATPLLKGWHTLTVLVTDRPWFKANQVPQRGVPDLARGATFDAVSFSFYCIQEPDEGAATGEEGECECSDAQIAE